MPSDDRIPSRSDPPAADDPGDWTVVSLVDPEGSGADAAFTDGLHNYGLPELLLWARPTEGDDPGADWLLTHDDRLCLLEAWACELLDSSLRPGDVRQQSLDHDTTMVCFRFGLPVAAQVAGAQQLPAERPVVAVDWSLTRRARPGPLDPASAAQRRVDRWVARTEAITASWARQRHPAAVMDDAARTAAAGAQIWRPAEPITPARFGPMAGWVAARVSQLCTAGAPVLAEFFGRIPAVSLVRCEHCVHERLLVLASRHGRSGPARETSNLADLVAMALTDGPDEPGCARSHPSAGPQLWHAEVDQVTRCIPVTHRSEVHRAMRYRLRQSIESVLLAAVVADLAPTPLMATACGAWEWAVHGGRVPGRAWLAPVGARSATRELLTGTGGTNLLIPPAGLDVARSWPCVLQTGSPLPAADPIAAQHLLAAAGQLGLGAGLASGLVPATERAAWLILGLQTAATGSARPGWLTAGPGVRPGTRRGSGLTCRQARQAEQLAGPLLTAVALPAELHPDTWQQLTAPLRPFVPGLPDEPPTAGLLR